MKTCAYCGKQYPDETTVCPADGEALPPAFAERKKVTGVWRGAFGYRPRETQPGVGPVGFTLKLKQGWLAHFEGAVTDDAAHGSPDTGTVDGYFNSPSIEFTKQMPVGYVVASDGTRMTLREFIIAEGHPCELDLPSPPVFFQGSLLDADRMQGIWTMNPRQMPMPGNLNLSMNQMSGFWCAQFITTDLKADPTGGPTETLFDKTLLSPREVEAVEGVAYCSLGKLNVQDAEALLERFGQADIRFEIKRDTGATQQAMPIMELTGGYAGTTEMIEVLVHPEDAADAEAILHQDDQV